MWTKILGWLAALLAFRSGKSAGHTEAHEAAVARQASIDAAVAEARADAPHDRVDTAKLLDDAKF